MNSKNILAVVAVALACQAPSWASTNVAIVNIPAVSERYTRTADLESKFEVKRGQLAEHRDELRGKIDRAVRSLREELKPGTDAFETRQKEAAMLEAEMQFFIESAGKRIERELAESLRSIFADIQDVVREVAMEQAIDVVLAADQMPPSAPETTGQVRQQIVLQKVLFWSPTHDITDEIVSRLNARYAKQQSAPSK